MEDRGDGCEIILEPCNELEAKKLISSIRSNSAGIDGLNLKTFKVAASYLLLCIVFLINISMEHGNCPDSLKIAKILPLPKTGILKDLSYWKPISVLPLLSKIYEKIIHKRKYDHLTKNGFLAETQFGFRKNHSTAHAEQHLINAVNYALEKGLYVLKSTLFKNRVRRIGSFQRV